MFDERTKKQNSFSSKLFAIFGKTFCTDSLYTMEIDVGKKEDESSLGRNANNH